MKVAKFLRRNPDGTRTLLRPYRVAIDEHGAAHRWSTAGPSEAPLPAGWRWATEADLPAEQIDDEYTA